jgi:hypothetical protein
LAHLIADHDTLTETTMEQNGRCFIIRSTPRAAASL